MTAALIISGILLFLVLLLSAPLRLQLCVRDALRITLRFCGIPIRLYPRKPKKVPRQLSRAALERRRRRALKKARKKRKKRKGDTAPPPRKPSAFRPEFSMLRTLYGVFRQLAERYRYRFLLRVNRLHITVGSPDAAHTAILYGLAHPATSFLLEFLDIHFRCRIPDHAVSVRSDFLAGQIRYDISLDVCTHLGTVLGLVLRGAWSFLHTSQKNLGE